MMEQNTRTTLLDSADFVLAVRAGPEGLDVPADEVDVLVELEVVPGVDLDEAVHD